MCTLANEYLFIGSRLGDSLLIAYSKDLPFEDQPAGTAEVWLLIKFIISSKIVFYKCCGQI